MKKLMNLKGAIALNKREQKTIGGGLRPGDPCTELQLANGFLNYPNGCFCPPGADCCT